MEAGEVVAAYAAAWEQGDPEAAFEFYDEHITMRVPGRGRRAGLHEGREAVIATVRSFLAETTGQSATVLLIDQLVSAHRVAMFARETVRRDETVLELRRLNLYQVRDDKIISIDIFEADQYAIDEFFD